MMSFLWDFLFSTGEDPVTFKQKIVAGFKEAGYFIGFGLILLMSIVFIGLAGIALLGTTRYWPPFLSLLAILGFLRGCGVLRSKRDKRRE